MQDEVKDLVPPGWLEPTLHGSYLKWLLRFNGYPESQIARYFDDRSGLYSYLELHNTLQSLEIEVASDHALDFGMNTSLAAHGLFGQAAVASANLDQAMTIIATYKPTRNNVFTYDWSFFKDRGVFTMSPRFDLRDYQETSTTATLINLVHIVIFLCGEQVVADLELSLPWELRLSNSFGYLKGIQIEKSVHPERVALAVPTAILRHENIFADARQFNLARRGCEEELQILRGRFTERVRSLIAHPEILADGDETIHWLSLGEVSEKLGLSQRTLNRRLKAERTSYGQILEQTRSDLACWYLKNTGLSVSRVSGILGYSDDTNFSRTFKRWKHFSPKAYRANSKQR